MKKVLHCTSYILYCNLIGNVRNQELPRASLAICKLLIQDCLMAGVNVLNTALKKVDRPDLQDKKLNKINEKQLHKKRPF